MKRIILVSDPDEEAWVWYVRGKTYQEVRIFFCQAVDRVVFGLQLYDCWLKTEYEMYRFSEELVKVPEPVLRIIFNEATNKTEKEERKILLDYVSSKTKEYEISDFCEPPIGVCNIL